MAEEIYNPQINISKMVVGGGIAGAFFAAVSTLIFLMGIPLTRIMLPAALILGGGIALVLRFVRHKTPGTPWILPTINSVSEARHDNGTQKNQDPLTRSTVFTRFQGLNLAVRCWREARGE
jgi:hypothetical protein